MNGIDDAVVQYAITTLVSIYGAGLFTWWWWKHGRASFVFMCVTLMFVGDIVEKGIQLYGRLLRNCVGLPENLEFIAGSIWAYRGVVSTTVSLIVVVYMTARVLRRNDKE